jgi:hypothetical protein
VVSLSPGSYVLTVQREGYVPSNEQVEIKAAERLTVRAKLEPLASTGFILKSDPSGATAVLDGRPLDGLTPLRVESMLPGKHHLEVRHQSGVWTQDVVVEAGKMLELNAVIGGRPAVAAAPQVALAAAPAPLPPPPPKKEAAAPKPEKIEREPVKPVKLASTEKAKPEKLEKPTKATPVALPRPPEEKAKPASTPKKTTPADSDDDDDNLPPPTKAKPAAPPPKEKPAPPPPAAKPAPAVASKPSGGAEGFLRLGSKPWTNISVDGKDTGLHTPQTKIKLGAGSHRITLTNPQFNIKETFSVDIKPGETETVIKDLRPASSDDSD